MNHGDNKQVRVALVEPQGWGKDPKLLAEVTLTADAKDWKKYAATLTPNADCKKAALQIYRAAFFFFTAVKFTDKVPPTMPAHP